MLARMAAPILDRARRIADELLAPAAAATDRAGIVPRENLDALAAAGLYGLGLGLEEDFATVCAAIEALAGGCLTTTFVWCQHLGVLQAVAASETPGLRERWLAPMARGEHRAMVSLTSSLPGPAPLRARRVAGGWMLDGEAPRVSGWGRVDVLHASARTDDERVVWGLLDTDGLIGERIALPAVDASNTVRIAVDGVRLPDERVTRITPHDPAGPVVPPATRVHAALALGVIGRCCALSGTSPLDVELAACRAELDAALEDPERMARARAASADLTLRASAAALVRAGARGVTAGTDVERLGREALFLSVFGLRAPIRTALLDRLERPR
jgi:alkylation response protein AidB-like acyl-CoA dehydrogenase